MRTILVLLFFAGSVQAAEIAAGAQHVIALAMGEERFDGGDLTIENGRGFAAFVDVFWSERFSTRAAAIEQLQMWADRIGVPLVKHKAGSDPAAVAHDAVAAAKARNADIVIIDTAGRLHNKSHLMQELSKIHRVVEKELPGAPHETLLVIDGTTGQNGVNQAAAFLEAAKVTGMVVTKLDGTAKGGVILSIMRQFDIPVKFIGVGEGPDDLLPFDPQAYVDTLFE